MPDLYNPMLLFQTDTSLIREGLKLSEREIIEFRRLMISLFPELKLEASRP